MIQKATGIILRTRPLTDTSLIVHWLTPDLGRVATAAKGARRPQSPFLGKLDLFYEADFSFSRSRHSDLHVLREVVVRETHDAIRGDLAKLRQAAYSTTLVQLATEAETPLSVVFELVRGFLDCICRQRPAPQLVFAFELRLLHELGLAPDLRKADLTAGSRQIVRALLNNDWPVCSRLKLTSAQMNELRQFLHGFIIFHLGHLPKGRAGALAGET